MSVKPKGASPRGTSPRARYDVAPGKVVRGVGRQRLYPKEEQAALLDLWRRRAMSLWNLLLGMEQAAYSGGKHRPELGWREIWVGVVEENHARDLDKWQHGSKRKDGSFRRPPGEGKEPVAPTEELLARMRGEMKDPRIFIWARELNAIMARLKAVPHTAWIGDLPSHAAQRVVTDLEGALKAMLREKRRREQGTGGRDTGFPRFKASRYAAGSVYFANTQMVWDFERSRVRLPNGVGWVRYDGGGARSRAGTGDKLMGARVFRRGEEWWISPQFEVYPPKAPAFTGRQVGVKVAGAVLATVYDGNTFEETRSRKTSAYSVARLRRWRRRLSRRLDAQEAKARRIARRGKRATARQRRGRGPRVPRSQSCLAALAHIAKLEGIETDGRNDLAHKTARAIVDGADHIAIERIDVAGMMKRADRLACHRSAKRQRRQQRKVASHRRAADGSGEIRHRAPPKVLRRALRRAAVARLLGYIKYKAEDAGRTVTETHELFPRVQRCRACGTLNEPMKDGRERHQCAKCGAIMRRQLNAADNIHEQAVIARRSGLEPE